MVYNSRKFKWVAGVSAIILLAASSVWATDGRPLVNPKSHVVFGAFDPNGDFTNDPQNRIEHVYVPWDGYDPASLQQAGADAAKHGRELLISIEPRNWSDVGASRERR